MGLPFKKAYFQAHCQIFVMYPIAFDKNVRQMLHYEEFSLGQRDTIFFSRHNGQKFHTVHLEKLFAEKNILTALNYSLHLL